MFPKIHHITDGGVDNILQRVAEKKAQLDAVRPLPNVVLQNLRESFSLEWTYNSNSIEGNTLTLSETRVVVEDGMTIGGKTIQEHLEAINHDRAIDYLEELVVPDYELRSMDLLNLHEIVMKGIDMDFAGRLRNGAVRIQGANITPPSPRKVSDLIDELITWVLAQKGDMSSVILTSIFHHRFEWIHPFFDGNGRTGRLAMNLILMAEGYPPAIILTNDRKKYYTALNNANKGDYRKLITLIAQSIERSLNVYLNALPDTYQEYLPLSEIVAEEDVPNGIEYISLLARRGKNSAHKEGRNLFTTKDEILNYYKTHNTD